jgi:FkbH-like protein
VVLPGEYRSTGLPALTFTEALKAIQGARPDARPFQVTLACGFTPLHLQTFLAAHLQRRTPDRKVAIATGLYGNVAGTLENAAAQTADGVITVLEWADLDPRLGFRSAGGWGREAAADIVSTVSAGLERIAAGIKSLSGVRVVLSLPTLPMPPAFHTPGWEASRFALAMQAELLRFASELAEAGAARVVDGTRLGMESPAPDRLDIKSDLQTGLPYTKQHAERLAAQLALALVPPAPKKGIISDLDDTLWDGLVGEVGPEGVHWDLASGAQIHGLYQKLLSSLAEHGTLVGIASKNDPAVVEKAFQRDDLLVRPEQVFPIEVSWNAKSGSVGRILEAWNVSADSVIFVDDSAMELAEVAAAHPGIECILFKKDSPADGLALLYKLRDLCGKERVSADDTIRLSSIREGSRFRQEASGTAAPEAFLASAEATITFDAVSAEDPRPLELVNKTNQFNLNGQRYTEADWRALLEHPEGVVLSFSYRDKFGPLGTIAVAGGVMEGHVYAMRTWVMSCRAFARRIEHQALRILFDVTGAEAVDFAFTPTIKNGPLQEFLAGLTGAYPEGRLQVTRAQFEAKCPALYQKVQDMRRVEVNG